FVGTMENCAQLLEQIVASPTPEKEMRTIATDYPRRKDFLPGFGHHLHKPDDPRSIKLLALARSEAELAQRYVEALAEIRVVVDEASGKYITINATRAVAAF